ncbi:MAG: hypothetical protein IT433_01365 [Phycisphaerales bacterium]|nr:hypothetical protein [Phycisphaerales bacterium]
MTTAQAPRALTRTDVLSMGRTSPPWEFLPIALAALRQAPGDHAVRLLAAAAFLKLGLRTPGLELLAGLPSEAAETPEAQSLERLARSLPSDMVPGPELERTLRTNLAALGERLHGPGTARELNRMEASVCRATDGNVVWRACSGKPWQLVGDFLKAAVEIGRKAAGVEVGVPLYLEGLMPPWVARDMLSRRGPQSDGYSPRTLLVHRDAGECMVALSLADLSEALRGPGVHLYSGEGATRALSEELAARIDLDVSGAVLVLTPPAARCQPGLPDVVRGAEAAQRDATNQLRARVDGTYAGRTPAWWARRYRAALEGGEPLRVLLPTSRHTTFLRHAVEDLARAMEMRGCRAKVMMEPDTSSKVRAPAFLRAFAEFDPDLVVFPNYPRAMFPELIPANVPHVCWVQDAMPHLFDRRIGAAQGPLDFVAGYAFEELFASHGYPRESAVSLPLAADETKFHAGPVEDAERYACEVAYVSHQSETPEAQHARLSQMFAEKLGVRTSLETLRRVVERETLKPLSEPHHVVMRDEVRSTLAAELRGKPEDRLVDTVLKAYCQPYADRLLRHQALEWAAESCRRRGWRLRVYGRGWERHPSLRESAAGELSHGEALRASYQCAGVHLHVAGQSLVHQRVFECVLSGGVPLCRFHAAERWGLLVWLLKRAEQEGAVVQREIRTEAMPRGGFVFERTGTPAMREAGRIFESLGLGREVLPAPDGEPDRVLLDHSIVNNHGFTRVPIEDWSAYWALGEQAGLFFHDRESLESRVEAALNEPGRRREFNQVALRNVRSRYTYSFVAERMIGLVSGSLG